ncbi:cold-shock protein [Niabella aurantiaca]|uniref:cold-shock protein n=1 Tax=Niabella aurantiaca TaxID=379900 RepID=UPI00035EAA81|nr:cold shock domain-containing protein [Niabella aurantiaca]
MGETWNKREREQKKRNAKKQKEEKKQERKENSGKGKSLNDMLAYVDEYGNLSETPPDKKARTNDYIPPVVANSRALNAVNEPRKGVITFFDSKKGYGFIRDTDTRESIFVHVNASPIELKENLKVAFDVQKGPKGLVAVNVMADV